MYFSETHSQINSLYVQYSDIQMYFKSAVGQRQHTSCQPHLKFDCLDQNAVDGHLDAFSISHQIIPLCKNSNGRILNILYIIFIIINAMIENTISSVSMMFFCFIQQVDCNCGFPYNKIYLLWYAVLFLKVFTIYFQHSRYFQTTQ